MYHAPLYVVKIRFVYEYMFRVVFCRLLVYNGIAVAIIILMIGEKRYYDEKFFEYVLE